MTAPDPRLLAAASLLARSQRADIATEIARLTPSAEPAVVFTSLARLCVPVFSDVCIVDIIENGDASYRIVYPPRAEPPSAPTTVAGLAIVRTRIESVGATAAADYHGVITHFWHTRRPGPAEVAAASLLVRFTVRTVHAERLNRDAETNQKMIRLLRSGIPTSHSIGVATGILMSRSHVSQDEAFCALSAASYLGEQRMSDTARDIIDNTARHPATHRTGPRHDIHCPTRDEGLYR